MSETEVQFLYSEAIKAEQAGNVDLAIENDLKIIQQYPNFKQKFEVYLQLLTLLQTQKKSAEVLRYAKEALLLHPNREVYSAVQQLRMQASIDLGKLGDAKTIASEVLKTKPDRTTASTILLLKAETMSKLGQHKDALASLDAAKPNTNATSYEVRIRSRSCGSKKMHPKLDDVLEFFHAKNLCFKEIVSLSAKGSVGKEFSQVWCEEFKKLNQSLEKVKTDTFTREKIQKELNGTLELAKNWDCS